MGGEGILLIILLYFDSTELVPTECIMLLSIFLLVQLRHPSYFWQTPVAAVEGHSHKLAEELGLYPRQTGHSGNTSGGDPVKRTRKSIKNRNYEIWYALMDRHSDSLFVTWDRVLKDHNKLPAIEEDWGRMLKIMRQFGREVKEETDLVNVVEMPIVPNGGKMFFL